VEVITKRLKSSLLRNAEDEYIEEYLVIAPRVIATIVAVVRVVVKASEFTEVTYESDDNDVNFTAGG
jgi:hypothetical protein